jgi:hypothetical protein
MTELCKKHGKPFTGDLVRLPKCLVERPVCEDCVEELGRARMLHPFTRVTVQMRLFEVQTTSATLNVHEHR